MTVRDRFEPDEETPCVCGDPYGDHEDGGGRCRYCDCETFDEE